ncbi:aminotransferase class I/II-fold pyridoxal phosphate-dependent enzyme [Methylobacterium sp. J-030]|uniref:threonine aldolase family protein n=1 Tax=Methylobacterium sp. J-030 TaxID=2836627 RepID=UPI001FBB439F|nr:threonine aldolase family protein [Methylobacterium sp. J-030]MCJ2070378.1 aminotransferase class I/II-fold pyridoxal phosphate-dependent enzyme [Methylobacterium sp. J-030]
MTQVAESPAVVDLRSDTVTRPTEAMFERMRSAPLGDDGLDADPTAVALEDTAAAMLGKAAGLFVPSCTMGNLLTILVQVQRSEQVLLEAQAHMLNTERGAATLTGAFLLGIPGVDGAMDLDRLEAALHPSASPLRTALIALETSHNAAGGTVLPPAHMAAVAEIARARGIPVHLDGARLFNAATHLGVPPAALAAHVDTVSLCLSKGLSAPMGAVLVGDGPAIAAARRLRKMIGGTQRQVGVVAAAGLEAITAMGARLGEDHARARQLSDGLNALGPRLSAKVPQTNIVQVDLARTGRDSARWVSDLDAAGIRTRPLGPMRLRLVTHRHIAAAAIDRAVAAFRTCLDAA